jgi:DNA gyrase subunit A
LGGTLSQYTSISFEEQIDLDQKRYSRYVCDSRAIPNEIDGMKPVQRRIMWTMWNSVAKTRFTKTVKVTGLVMGYHPHGDAAINDTISSMAQGFTFSNNYPFISGEGTFGDVLDPKAIASPRYTEVKLSEFAIDAGIFESIPDIDYVSNYDDTSKEPVFFVPKVPLVLLNSITGIATGFRCSMHGHRLTDVVDAMIKYLKKKTKPRSIEPWYKEFKGTSQYKKNDKGTWVYTTGFGFKVLDGGVYLISAPQGMNREKVIDYLETAISKSSDIRAYSDYSTDEFKIQIIPKKGVSLTPKKAVEIFNKVNNEQEITYVITSQGRLVNVSSGEIIPRFCEFRKKHLIKRFKRLSLIEKEKIERNTELIRFIKEGWNKKVTSLKSKKDFESKLKTKKFVFFEWLSGIPVYRMTLEEVKKCKDAITEAKAEYKRYQQLIKSNAKLVEFMITEIKQLKKKWDS